MLQRVITLCVWSRLPFSIIGGLFLLGCSKPILPADVAGTWVSSKASQAAIKSTNNYQLLFQADGTVMGSVPDFMIEAPDKSSGRVRNGKGTWALQNKAIKITFSEVDGQRINWGAEALKIQRSGKDFVLFFFLEEEGGKRFVFERSQNQK